MSEEAFIHIRDLSYAYVADDGSPIPVLKQVSLDVREGEYVVVLGHNGSGKSTLAKLLNLVVDDYTFAEGTVRVGGTDVMSLDLTEEEILELRRRVGMVFQNPDNQLVATIVEEDVAFGPENLGIPHPELRERVDNALATVGMSEYARHEPHRLSGGQKQRVAIAGIIAMMPRCMIFDESTAMLDPVGRREVIETIEKLNREQGITVISITHYMDEAARADRVVVLSDGRIVLDGTPGEVFTQGEVLRRAGLELPQHTAVCQYLTASGIPVCGEINTPDQCAEAILTAWKEKAVCGSTVVPPPAAAADSPVDPTENPKLRLENITYRYSRGTPFEVRALDDVTLDIRRGSLTGIIGHTGSGKSTLVQLLNGLAKAESGRILLDSADIWEHPKEIGRIRFRVGLVMQYPEYQLFEETVWADIAYGPRNMKLPEEEVRARVAEAVAFVGLEPDVLEKSPFDLSGGQKRRVAIAGIMAMRPEVLVLDEPAAGLDPRGRHTIFQGIRDYNRRTGCTVIIVSHSMEDMAQYCDDVVVMAHARVLMSGSRDEVFSRADELEAVGLDIPQITKLAVLLARGGMPVPVGIYTPEAAETSLLAAFNRDPFADLRRELADGGEGGTRA